MKAWGWSCGDRGLTVSVREYKRPGGVIYIGAPDPMTDTTRWVSLGHRDKQKARRQARKLLVELQDGKAVVRSPTLGYIRDLYLHERLSVMKLASAKWITQNLGAWVNYLGPTFRVVNLSPREWEGFGRLRLSGEIDGSGRPVESMRRRTVKPGTVNLAFDALRMCLNWATLWRVEGKPVLENNPVRRFPYLDDVNPQRSVWTYDRFLKVVQAAKDLQMEVEWSGRRERLPCYLADVLAISEGTGRRIGAVRQLRYTDLILSEGQHGKVHWRADTDKTGKEWITPISPDVRKALLRVIRERPGLGEAPLFPAPRDANKPVDEDTLRLYLRRAEKAAGVSKLPQDSFHGLRRKFVTERKHVPDVDVAEAGGWRSINTMKRAYQRADEAGVLEAILEPRRLRDHA